LTRVTGAAACDAQRGGWYFDDAANPKAILVCPARCTAVKASAQHELSMLSRCLAR
jgi:hypothetical protein